MKTACFLLLWLAAGTALAQTFTLHSRDLGGQATSAQVYNDMGCTGENRSPQLSWTHPPAGVKSYAVVIHDADAPTGSGWWHWLIFDIPATVTELKTGAGDPGSGLAPAGAIQSRTDFGIVGYGGPCPPEGSRPHAYRVTVYAMPQASLGLTAETVPAVVGFYLENYSLARASLLFYYNR